MRHGADGRFRVGSRPCDLIAHRSPLWRSRCLPSWRSRSGVGASGLFGWFGGQVDRSAPKPVRAQRQYVPPQANAYADPFGQQAPEQSRSSPSSRRHRPLCRLLRAHFATDGYFPMQRHANALRSSFATRSAPPQRHKCSPGARSITRSRRTARAMRPSTMRSSTARRSFRAAPATARTRSASPRSTSRTIRRCGRATS